MQKIEEEKEESQPAKAQNTSKFPAQRIETDGKESRTEERNKKFFVLIPVPEGLWVKRLWECELTEEKIKREGAVFCKAIVEQGTVFTIYRKVDHFDIGDFVRKRMVNCVKNFKHSRLKFSNKAMFLLRMTWSEDQVIFTFSISEASCRSIPYCICFVWLGINNYVKACYKILNSLNKFKEHCKK